MATAWPAATPLLQAAPGSPQPTVQALSTIGLGQLADPTAPASGAASLLVAHGAGPAPGADQARSTSATAGQGMALADDATAERTVGSAADAALAAGEAAWSADSAAAYPVLAMMVGAMLVLAGWRRARRA